MRAIVLDRPGTFRAAEVPEQAPRPTEMVAGVDCFGICGGRTQALGVSQAKAVIRVSPFRVYNDELTIAGSMAVPHNFGPAVDLLNSGTLDPGALLPEPLPLEVFGEAVDRVRSGRGIKWHICPSRPGQAGP